jgi:hypothetical protein
MRDQHFLRKHRTEGGSREDNWVGDTVVRELRAACCFQYAEAFAVAQHKLRDAGFPGFGERFAQ